MVNCATSSSMAHTQSSLRLKLYKLIGLSLLVIALFTLTTNFYAYALGGGVEANELISLVNNYRKENGLASLRLDPELTIAAEARVRNMLEEGYFAHTSPSGKKLDDWLGEAAYRYTIAGENIAYGYVEAQNVFNGWVASAGHRENLLRDSFTETGIASISGYYKGKIVTFTVQIFGNPKISSDPAQTYQPILTPFPTIPPGASSVIPKFYFSKNLRYGMNSLDVWELQERLFNEGYLTVAPTGYFGTKTLEAVTKFQSSKGIMPHSGFVGPLTRGALNAAA